MSKLLFLTLAFIFLNKISANGQVFYGSMNSKNYKSMLSGGITYIPTGNAEKDAAIVQSLKKIWKLTDFLVYDKENNDFKIGPKDIVLTEMSLVDGLSGEKQEDLLCLIPLEVVLAGNGSKYMSVGYFSLNGFPWTDGNYGLFSDLVIGSLHTFATIIKEKNTAKSGIGLYKEIAKEILPKSSVLKEKTLIILKDYEKHIDEGMLKKEGIKYEIMTLEQYSSLALNNELSSYCLFYFSYGTYTDFSIFDLETKEIIYNKHYINGMYKIGGSEFLPILKIMNPK